MMRRRMSEGNAWPSPAGASRRRFRLREVVAMRGADSGATRNQTPEVVQVLRVSAGTVVRDRTPRNARRRSAGIAGDQHGELQRYARLRRRHGARAEAGAAADYLTTAPSPGHPTGAHLDTCHCKRAASRLHAKRLSHVDPIRLTVCAPTGTRSPDGGRCCRESTSHHAATKPVNLTALASNVAVARHPSLRW
jgi:hypothetical protein